VADILRRFGELCRSRRQRRRAAPTGDLDLAEIVRALDFEGLPVANLQLHALRSTTCSWRRPAGRWRVPRRAEAEADPEPEQARR
jgi:hypothetical protein